MNAAALQHEWEGQSEEAGYYYWCPHCKESAGITHEEAERDRSLCTARVQAALDELATLLGRVNVVALNERGRANEAVAMLRRLEWEFAGGDWDEYTGGCGVCEQNHAEGHADDCEYDALLQAAETGGTPNGS